MMKSILASVAVALFAAPAFAEEAQPAETCAARAAGANAETIIVKVNGMVCDFCARAVSKVFIDRGGVDSVDIDLDAGEIILADSGCLSISEEKIKELVFYSGYDFVSMERQRNLPALTDTSEGEDG